MANTSISQSVARLFEILELFEKERRPLSSQEIVSRTGAPRSSIAALLKNLVELSILSVDRRSATYFPTAQFGRLGSWLTEAQIRDPALLGVIHDLQQKVGETVTLGGPLDHCVELLFVERSAQVISFVAEPGQKLPFWSSAVGITYLSTLSNSAVKALYDRLSRRGGEWAPTIPLEEILQDLEQAREAGFFVGQGRIFAEASALSISLPEGAGLRQLILSVVGPNDRINAKQGQIIEALMEARMQIAD